MINNLSSGSDLAFMQASHAMEDKFSSIKDMNRIDSAAQDFEAVFISEMMKPMFQGLKTDGMFGGGQAEEVFRSVMIQEFGKVMAKTERIGIAAPVKAAMIEAQAARTKMNEATTATVKG